MDLLLLSICLNGRFQFCPGKLGLCDFPIYFTIFQQFCMCTFSDNLSIIQDKDLLCMQNGTDSLCYDQNCTFPRLLCKGMTQCHIRLIVKSRKTVIKNKYLWMLCNRSCNRKSLLLTTGYIGTALLIFGLWRRVI